MWTSITAKATPWWCDEMMQQLSLEILLSMSVSIILAGMGYLAYSHAYSASNNASSTVGHIANLLEYYAWSLSNACACQSGG